MRVCACVCTHMYSPHSKDWSWDLYWEPLQLLFQEEITHSYQDEEDEHQKTNDK